MASLQLLRIGAATGLHSARCPHPKCHPRISHWLACLGAGEGTCHCFQEPFERGSIYCVYTERSPIDSGTPPEQGAEADSTGELKTLREEKEELKKEEEKDWGHATGGIQHAASQDLFETPLQSSQFQQSSTGLLQGKEPWVHLDGNWNSGSFGATHGHSKECPSLCFVIVDSSLILVFFFQYCLSGHPTLPCNVLKFKSTTIMLDCGLDMTSTLNFLPLPLVQRLLMEELVNFIERVPKAQSASLWKNKEVQRSGVEMEQEAVPELDVINRSPNAFPIDSGIPARERQKRSRRGSGSGPLAAILTASDCSTGGRFSGSSEDLLNRPQIVLPSTLVLHRNEKHKELFGAVHVTPLSSGYALGSSNWIIQSHYEKVSYVSGSSLLTTHPQAMDQASLKNSDVLILTGLTQIPTANPDGMVGEFCSNLAMTVRNGGNVLVPCYPSGVIYDLLECLYQYIDSAGLSNVPFYFISPVANSSLEFSQIFAEWLCHNKQTKVYLPEPPFPHAETQGGEETVEMMDEIWLLLMDFETLDCWLAMSECFWLASRPQHLLFGSWLMIWFGSRQIGSFLLK
ncbi:Integrator complex subunit 9 [Chelonia mydas]|uniref:Integrator complex subunit 9 n=1 Tax=Chelonia mydas TaxID=8469 RepID=M7BWQ4_CHEMY|nr:Integrator complex subunit 9 [Chelonia mydas]